MLIFLIETLWDYFTLCLVFILLQSELSPECMAKVNEVFDIFDVDQSHAIDKNEALNHWKRGFGRLSANEFFNQVDVNGDGEITKEEF